VDPYVPEAVFEIVEPELGAGLGIEEGLFPTVRVDLRQALEAPLSGLGSLTDGELGTSTGHARLHDFGGPTGRVGELEGGHLFKRLFLREAEVARRMGFSLGYFFRQELFDLRGHGGRFESARGGPGEPEYSSRWFGGGRLP
jgi:hypothetical protein